MHSRALGMPRKWSYWRRHAMAASRAAGPSTSTRVPPHACKLCHCPASPVLYTGAVLTWTASAHSCLPSLSTWAPSSTSCATRVRGCWPHLGLVTTPCRVAWTPTPCCCSDPIRPATCCRRCACRWLAGCVCAGGRRQHALQPGMHCRRLGLACCGRIAGGGAHQPDQCNSFLLTRMSHLLCPH